MNLLRGVVLSMVLLAPSLTQAAAGQVLFALGRVEIQRNGQALAAARGTPVEVGDVVSTGPTGLAQLRMQDGALLSLRYGSSMKVEDYRMPVAAAPATTPGAATPVASGGRSVLRLLRGAFRTVSGLIGKGPGDSYSVATPVATIGIRGTDYSAAYCSGDCGGVADGLYLGVSNGGIDVTNDAGKLALGNDQYGYVRDNATPPERELAPPAVLDAPIPPDDERQGDGERDAEVATDGAASDTRYETADGRTYETGDTQPEGGYEVRSGPGRYAYASNGTSGSAAGTVFFEGGGGLVGFDGDVRANIGTAANFDVGSSSDAGVVWGRWHGGAAEITNVDGTYSADLTTTSLHWIYAADGSDRAVLPVTGSQSYTLAGGTNPTDSGGNVGTLGSAYLYADFTNLTVNTSVDLTMNGPTGGTVTWSASGQGSITADTFSGSYSLVYVGGAPGGSGGFTGFFTNGGAGAGLTFDLTDANFTTTVNGAVGFVAGSAAGVGGP